MTSAAGMPCPVCRVSLVMSERQGVEMRNTVAGSHQRHRARNFIAGNRLAHAIRYSLVDIVRGASERTYTKQNGTEKRHDPHG